MTITEKHSFLTLPQIKTTFTPVLWQWLLSAHLGETDTLGQNIYFLSQGYLAFFSMSQDNFKRSFLSPIQWNTPDTSSLWQESAWLPIPHGRCSFLVFVSSSSSGMRNSNSCSNFEIKSCGNCHGSWIFANGLLHSGCFPWPRFYFLCTLTKPMWTSGCQSISESPNQELKRKTMGFLEQHEVQKIKLPSEATDLTTFLCE